MPMRQQLGPAAIGNPWPPPLPRELCEPIGFFGGPNDDNLRLLREANVTAAPLVEPAAGDAAARRGEGGGHGQQRQPTVLCLMYTMETQHATSVRAARETWAGGCDGFLAFSTRSDPRLPAIALPHVGPEAYDNMWQKIRSMWTFVSKHYVRDFDYFIIGGEDLYILPGNLRAYLATVGSPDQVHFLGRRFKGRGRSNYFNSGGAGYVLSRAALERLAPLLNTKQCGALAHTSMEDVMVAQCLRKALGVNISDTRDAQGRERFHPFSPGTHYNWRPPKPGNYADRDTLETARDRSSIRPPDPPPHPKQASPRTGTRSTTGSGASSTGVSAVRPTPSPSTTSRSPRW